MRVAFLDVETKYLFHEVEGGKAEKLGLAVAALIINKEKVKFFEEKNVSELFELLSRVDLIVGHNLLSFDYAVLNPYADFDVYRAYQSKTLDTLKELEKLTGVRVSLEDLARNNLGRTKSADPAQIPLLWRKGYFDKVRNYCAHDVELLRDLYYYAKSFGHLAYTHREYGIVMGIKEVKVNW